MPRLSETARRLLESALRHEGLGVPPPRTAKEIRATRALLRAGRLRETRTLPGELTWRTDEEGASWALTITRAGRAAIGEPPGAGRSESRRARAARRQVAERLIAIFTEAHGRPPVDIEEFERFIRREVRAAWRRGRH